MHSRLCVRRVPSCLFCLDYWVGIRSTGSLAAILALSMVRERYFYIETTNCQVKHSFTDNCWIASPAIDKVGVTLLKRNRGQNPVFANVAERQAAYRKLFLNAMDASQLHQLREALNQELVLGREDYKNKIERMTQRQVRRGKDGRPRVEDILGKYDVTDPSILEQTGI